MCWSWTVHLQTWTSLCSCVKEWYRHTSWLKRSLKDLQDIHLEKSLPCLYVYLIMRETINTNIKNTLLCNINWVCERFEVKCVSLFSICSNSLWYLPTLIFPSYFWTWFIRVFALALSFPPLFCLFLDAPHIFVALERAARTWGARRAVITVIFSVQWEGEGSAERGRRPSALSSLSTLGPVLVPAGAQLHFLLPL